MSDEEISDCGSEISPMESRFSDDKSDDETDLLLRNGQKNKGARERSDVDGGHAGT